MALSAIGPAAKVLVTGATGFVGRHLVAALVAAGASVGVLVRRARLPEAEQLWSGKSVEVIGGDLLHPSTITGACGGFGTVFHLASYAPAQDLSQARNDEMHWRVSLEGTRALIHEAIRAGTKRFVFASTVKATGEVGPSCLDETNPLEPESGYGVAKRVAEQVVLEAGRVHGMHVSVLRFPLLYGRDNEGSLARLIAAVAAGWWPPLPLIRNRRSMVHVDDVIGALLLVAERPEANGNTYIVTDGQFYSTSDIDALIRVALGKGIPRWHVPKVAMQVGARLGDVIGRLRGRDFVFNSDVLGKLTESVCYSNEKIAKELGFRPTRTLAGGLQEMVGQSRFRSAGTPRVQRHA